MTKEVLMNPHIQDQPSSEQDAKVREKIKRKDEEAPTQEDWTLFLNGLTRSFWNMVDECIWRRTLI